MRNVIYKIAACSALVALVLSGCKESFLEEDPNGYISSDQIKENAVSLQGHGIAHDEEVEVLAEK